MAQFGRIASSPRRVAGAARRLIGSLRPPASESDVVADSRDYWRDADDEGWRSNSHWRDGDAFAGGDLWSRIGARHLGMVEAGARMVGFTRPWTRVVEWGCGGGANAVHFAPKAEVFLGVDVSADTLSECERQVGAVCDTRFEDVLIDVAAPEAATAAIGEPCDLFLCFYVFELIPSPEYGERVLRIARDVLAPGGLALVQIKYHEGRRPARRRRDYRTSLADTTTYAVTEFWELAQRCGFRPESVTLVPKDELDERYAYFLLSRP